MKELLLTPQKLDSVLSREGIQLRGIPTKTTSRQDSRYCSWVFHTEPIAIQLLQHIKTSSVLHCATAILTSMPEGHVARALRLSKLLALEAVSMNKVIKTGQVFSRAISAFSEGYVSEQVREVPKTIQIRAKLHAEAGIFLIGLSKLPMSKEELALVTAPELPAPASGPSLAAYRN